MPLLELENVETLYGNIMALKGISFSLAEGEIITLIGANGAGKSTTLMTICGIAPPRAGQIRFRNKPIQQVEPHAIVALGISQVPEGRRIFPLLTVTENLAMGAFLRKDSMEIARDRDYLFSLFPILRERRHQPGGTLSGGEQQMLAISRALMARPSLLLLDEPSLGLAPLVIAEIFSALDELRAQGVTILLVEQDARLALRHADRGSVMRTGRVVLEAPAADLLADESVRTIYLGAWHQEGS
jgi:branched-chain amino acid transport system ATP-binding protein